MNGLQILSPYRLLIITLLASTCGTRPCQYPSVSSPFLALVKRSSVPTMPDLFLATSFVIYAFIILYYDHVAPPRNSSPSLFTVSILHRPSYSAGNPVTILAAINGSASPVGSLSDISDMSEIGVAFKLISIRQAPRSLASNGSPAAG